MNLSYGETEYDYRLFPCLRVTDLRKKPGGTLRPRWTGFTSMRVQGLMVSVSKWQVHCPNSSHLPQLKFREWLEYGILSII